MLVKVVRRISYPFVGYLFLILAFALLGLFVVALAYRSSWAALAGVAWSALSSQPSWVFVRVP